MLYGVCAHLKVFIFFWMEERDRERDRAPVKRTFRALLVPLEGAAGS